MQSKHQGRWVCAGNIKSNIKSSLLAAAEHDNCYSYLIPPYSANMMLWFAPSAHGNM